MIYLNTQSILFFNFLGNYLLQIMQIHQQKNEGKESFARVFYQPFNKFCISVNEI